MPFRYVQWSDGYLWILLAAVALTAAVTAMALRRRWRALWIAGPAWLLVAGGAAYITVRITSNLGRDVAGGAREARFVASDGRVVKIADFRGKVVLLDFWATWCPPCRASLPAVADLGREFGSRGLVVVGVSGDEDEGAWREFLGRGTGGRVETLDRNGELARAFEVQGRPVFLLLDRAGRTRWRMDGWSPYSYAAMRRRIESMVGE